MASLIQIRTSIREQLSGRVSTDDNRLRDRFVDKVIRDVRAVLVMQEMGNGVGVDSGWINCINCLQIQCGTITCGSQTMQLNTSYIDGPEMIGEPIYLGSPDGKTVFSLTSMNAIILHAGGSFNKPYPLFAMEGERLIIKGHPSRMKYVRLCGTLADPMNGICQQTSVNDLYPVPADRVHKLELLAIKQLLATQPLSPDLYNDAQDLKNGQPPVDQRTLQPTGR